LTLSADPDGVALGVLGRRPDPLRYGQGDTADPAEAPALMRSLLPANARVLDVGCGAGGVTTAINSGKNNTVLCIEPDPERGAAARGRGLQVVSGVFDEDFAKTCGAFDAIVFADVLEHLADPARVVALAGRCLRPGGVLIVSVPNVAHWTVRLRLLFGRFDYRDRGIMDATHLRWFTRKTLVAMLAHAGFQVSAVHGSVGLWMPEYWRKPLSLLPQRVRRRLVLLLMRAFPGLMACQHVAAATIPEARPAAAGPPPAAFSASRPRPA
jgi:methionine biosynthesis protein MetW